MRFPGFLLRAAAATIGVGLLLIVGLILFVKFYPEYYTVGTYELPGGYKATIEGANSWEYNQPFYYSITQGGREVVPRTFHMEINERTKFAVLDSGRGVLALARANSPFDVLMMFDTRTGEAWPGEIEYAQAQSMLQTLRSNPAYATVELGGL